MPGPNRSTQKIRMEIAQLAAKMLAMDTAPDYLAAKRKAAARLGVKLDRFMPTNQEVEQALIDYQRLFQHDAQRSILETLRRTAVDAMTFLAPFRPLLTGPVLNGTATEHSEVILHLFSSTPDEISHFLDAHGIPHRATDWTIKIRVREWIEVPAFRLVAGDTNVVLVVFSNERHNVTPLSPIDGRPMQRAGLSELRSLLPDPA